MVISVPDRDSYTTAAATIDIIPHSRTGDVSHSNENRYNHVVFIDQNGNPACISYLNAPQMVSEQPTTANLPAIFAHLILVDVVRKENGKWRFAHRIFDQLRIADYAGLDEATRQRIARTQAERAASNGELSA